MNMASASSLLLVVLTIVLSTVNCQSERGRRPDDRRRRDQTLQGCVGKEMDIYFILDSSTSIYIEDFKRERQFVRDVVARLDVGQRATRVGILTFSDEIEQPTVGLSQNPTKSEVLSSVSESNLPYRTGTTNTHLAIRYVRENTEFRRGVVKVMVVVTDGGSLAQDMTAREAEQARRQGFYNYVVGVGQYLDENEWRAIASDPDDSFIYNITNFRQLTSVANSLAPSVCGLTPGGGSSGGRGGGGGGRGGGGGGRGGGDGGRGGGGVVPPGGPACGPEQRADLFFVAAPGGTADAFTIIDSIAANTRDRRRLISSSFMIDACENANNVRMEDIDNYCDRFRIADSGDSDAFTRLLKQMRDQARRNRANGAERQVAVLFVDEESMNRDRFSIVNEARTIERYGDIEFVVVDLGVVSYGNFVYGMAQNRDNIIRFERGRVGAQREALSMLLEKTCDAVNRVTFDVNVS